MQGEILFKQRTVIELGEPLVIKRERDLIYEAGDKVYFKLPTVNGWKGPARVLRNDGYTVLVKQGGSTHKCHRSNVMKIRDAEHNVEVFSKSKKD